MWLVTDVLDNASLDGLIIFNLYIFKTDKVVNKSKSRGFGNERKVSMEGRRCWR